MNNLIRLVGRRLVLLPIMVLGVTFLVFVLMSLSPIDPAYAALGESATPEALAAYRETNGPMTRGTSSSVPISPAWSRVTSASTAKQDYQWPIRSSLHCQLLCS